MDAPALFEEIEGSSPLLINVPHAGIQVPAAIAERFSDEASCLPDTDWYVDRLYAFATALGASLQVANYSRYVIDLNRPPDDHALYDQTGSGLMPVKTFAGDPIYQQGKAPSKAEQRQRLQQYWQPYHQRLQHRLLQIKDQYGYAILLDAHSIQSEVPRLFQGELPVLNLGTYSGASADAGLVEKAEQSLSESAFTLVRDQRFKGGYITRHYGRPTQGQHALQLEIAQRAYMQEQPPVWDATEAKPLQAVLTKLVNCLLDWRPSVAPV